MNASTLENQPAVGRDGGRGYGVGIVAGGFIVFLAVVLLVLPGFMAAGLSRVERGYLFCVDGEVFWDQYQLREGVYASYRVVHVFLAPSGWLMEHSQGVRLFYNWQYHAAGGVNERSPFEL